MSNAPGSITSVRWTSLFPWLILVRAARVSLMLRVILLALAGVVVTQLGWALVERVVLDDSTTEARLWRLTEARSAWLPGAELDIEADRGLAVQADAYGGPLVRGWGWASQPFVRMVQADSLRRWVARLLEGLWAIAVWALFGGAITRIAALYLSHGEAIDPLAALRSATARWLSTAGAPAALVLVLLVVALGGVLAGWLISWNPSTVLMGLLWILVILLVGVPLALTAFTLALGWPLMWSTVAVERTDAFDAISRAFAYLFQRPLHALFYVLVAGVLGLLAQMAVNLFVDASLTATRWAVSGGADDQRVATLLDETYDERREELGALGAVGGEPMRFWTLGFRSIAAAFPMAYLFSAAVGIYLLLRRQIDATELTEVTLDAGDPQRGLPTLVKDPATGVPRVADEPGATDVAPTSPPAP
jgi:hypothetical protein